MFAARYGYSLDKFYSLTLRQIFQLKEVIGHKLNEEATFQAKLHDKLFKSPEKPLDIKLEVRKRYDDQAQNVYERLKKDYEKRQHGNRQRITDKN